MMIQRIDVRPASLEVLADIAYSTRFTEAEQRLHIDSYERVKNLLEDLGLDPDRKYVQADIDQIRAGIAYVLGGRV